MANLLQLRVITPSKEILHTSCSEVYLPGEKGEFGVLFNHAPLIALLRGGELRYKKDSKIEKIQMSPGWVHVHNNTVIVSFGAVRLDPNSKTV